MKLSLFAPSRDHGLDPCVGGIRFGGGLQLGVSRAFGGHHRLDQISFQRVNLLERFDSARHERRALLLIIVLGQFVRLVIEVQIAQN